MILLQSHTADGGRHGLRARQLTYITMLMEGALACQQGSGADKAVAGYGEDTF
jgi:hypothetical protein